MKKNVKTIVMGVFSVLIIISLINRFIPKDLPSCDDIAVKRSLERLITPGMESIGGHDLNIMNLRGTNNKDNFQWCLGDLTLVRENGQVYHDSFKYVITWSDSKKKQFVVKIRE